MARLRKYILAITVIGIIGLAHWSVAQDAANPQPSVMPTVQPSVQPQPVPTVSLPPVPAPTATPNPVSPAPAASAQPSLPPAAVPAMPASGLTKDTPAPSAAGAPSTTAPAAATMPRPLKSIIEEDVKSDSEKNVVPDFEQSIMFKKDDIDKARLVYNAYMEKLKNNSSDVPSGANPNNGQSSKIDEILGKLAGTKKDLPPPPPSIYLNSILFRSAGQAAAWINGKKFEIGTMADGLKVVDITPYHANVIFSAGKYNFDFNPWIKTFGANADKSKILSSQEEIHIDQANHAIMFSLRPNQHIDFAALAIREGKANAPAAAKAEDVKDIKPKTPALTQDATPIDLPTKPQTPPSDVKNSINFKVAPDGHFYVPAELNSQTINFKVDTGATVTAISIDDAKKAGINVGKLNYDQDVKLADATVVKAAITTVDSFSVGPIKLNNVTILVAQGSMDQPLLGMSFFSKLKQFTIQGDTLTLYQ